MQIIAILIEFSNENLFKLFGPVESNEVVYKPIKRIKLNI